jgi:hypothetical protein
MKDFWADRAARNIHNLSPFEESAIINNEKFRDRVITSFHDIYGEGAQLDVVTDGSRLQIYWFRPTELIYSAPAKQIEPAFQLIDKIDSSLVDTISNGRLSLFELTSLQFEEFMCELLEKYGYRVELTKQTHDGGYDIIGGKVDNLGLNLPLIVQCKRFRKDRTIGVALVRELHGVQTTMNIPHAIFATTSTFSREAKLFATSHVRWGFMTLADYSTIINWVAKASQ